MKNGEAIILRKNLIAISEMHFDSEKVFFNVPEKVLYAINKNIRKLKPITVELEEMEKDSIKSFKENRGIKDEELQGEALEKANIDFVEYKKSAEINQIFADFGNEKCEIELYKIEFDVDSLSLPYDCIEILANSILTEI